jgi:hypothetical protein
VEIPLSQGQVTVIDDIDADLAGLGWYAHKGKQRKTFYACRKIVKGDGRRTAVRLHQVIARRMGIIGAPDHIDRNGLNNRRDNLRPDPHGQGNANRTRFANNTSGLKGVCWHRQLAKWRAQIKVAGKQRHLGLFADPIEAAKAYDRAALEAFGEFAVLNYPAP